MPTHHELSLMSKQVYFKSGGFVQGWECTDYFSNQNGFGAAVYKSNTKNEMVIAFRGIDVANIHNLLKNLLTNAKLMVGLSPKAMEQLHDFIRKIRNNRSRMGRLLNLLSTGTTNQLYLTGHSLGAVLAEMAGHHFITQGKDYQIVTFESPGCANLIDETEHKKFSKQHQEQMTTYLSEPNAINTLNPHVGKIRQLHIKPYKPNIISKASYYTKHAIQCVVNDAYRILFALSVIDAATSMMISTAFLTPVVLDTLSRTLQFLLDTAGAKWLTDYIDPTASVGALFAFLTVSTLLFSLKNEITQILERHQIELISKQFANAKGLPKRYSEISSWPTTTQYGSSYLKMAFSWMKPLSKSNPNINTLFDPIKMENEQTKELPGYQEGTLVTP